MFVRVLRPRDQKEILVNVNHVWKIEVQYALPGGNMGWLTSLEEGAKNPDAVRFYRIFVGSEEISLAENPDDPVVKVFEQIYKDAVKA